MNTIVGLLIGSAALGVVIGVRCRVFAIIGLAPVLAVAAATALREICFVAMVGIAFACISVSQTAYFLVAWLSLICAESVMARTRSPHIGVAESD
jgi:hypothetical protein